MTVESLSQAPEENDYNPVMTALARRPKMLRLLLPLLVLLFAAISGNALAGPKPASGQFLTAATLVGAEPLQDATLHQAVWKIAPKPASECSVAAEGAGTGMAFAGHGIESSLAGTTVVPEGTTIMIPEEAGLGLPDAMGTAMEAGDLSGASALPGSTTYLPGAEIPNLLLGPGPDLSILPNSITVQDWTPLSELLQPNMSNMCWAACRSIP